MFEQMYRVNVHLTPIITIVKFNLGPLMLLGKPLTLFVYSPDVVWIFYRTFGIVLRWWVIVCRVGSIV